MIRLDLQTMPRLGQTKLRTTVIDDHSARVPLLTSTGDSVVSISTRDDRRDNNSSPDESSFVRVTRERSPEPRKTRPPRTTMTLGHLVRSLYPLLIGLGLVYIFVTLIYNTLSPIVSESDSHDRAKLAGPFGSRHHVQKRPLVQVPDPHFWKTEVGSRGAPGPNNWTGTVLRPQPDVFNFKSGQDSENYPITMDDFLGGNLRPPELVSTWLSDTELIFQDEEHSVKMYDSSTNQQRTLLTADFIEDNHIDWWQISPDRTHFLFATKSKEQFRYSFDALYYLYNIVGKSMTPLPPVVQNVTSLTDFGRLQFASFGAKGTQLVFVDRNDLFFKRSVTEPPELINTELRGIMGSVSDT